MNNQNLTCQFDFNCDINLSKPMRLSCGVTICRKHFEEIRIKDQKCPFCFYKHDLNDEHLDDLKIKCKNKLDVIFLKLEEMKLFNFDDLLVDHFEWLRNDLYLKHKRLVENLKNKSKKLINESNKIVLKHELDLRLIELNEHLDSIELKCEKNLDELLEKKNNEFDRECLDENELLSLNHIYLNLKMKNLNKKVLDNISMKLNSILTKIEFHFNKLKNRVFINKYLNIDDYLGCLNIIDGLSIDCGRLEHCLYDSFVHDHFQTNEDRILSILIVDSLNLIITGSGHIDDSSIDKHDSCSIKIWSLDNGGLIKKIMNKIHFGPIGCIINDLNRKLFLTCSYDGKMGIFDLITYGLIKSYSFKDGLIRMCLLPNTRLACLRFNGQIRVYDFNDVLNLKRVANLNYFNDIDAHGYSCLELTSQMDQLIGCNDNNYVCVWNSIDFTLIEKLNSVRTAKAVSNDSSNSILILNVDNSLRLIQLVKKSSTEIIHYELRTLIEINLNNNYDLCGFEINLMTPISNRIVALNDHYEIVLFDLEKGIKIMELIGHAKVLNCLDFSHERGFLATGSDDQTIRVWKIF